MLSSGLLHEIDAKVTVRGPQRRVTFPHKLFMDYLAAWFICKQNIQESLEQAFQTWDDVEKHEEIVRACCGLMRGREEVIVYAINVLKAVLMKNDIILSYKYYVTMSSFQNECGIQTLFVHYPSCGHPLSQVLNTAKLVVIEDLSSREYDDALPCNADIVIDARLRKYNENVTASVNSGVMRTLQRHRDHIIVIKLEYGSQDVMEQMSSLLPSSSLGCLSMFNCYLSKEVVNSLAEMPQLTQLTIWGSKPEGEDNSLVSHGDLLVAAIKAWNGHSKLQLLKLGESYLPVSVCRPLLVAIAANCPCLEELYMGGNTLSGCLAGFLQNPPPALRNLGLSDTHLQPQDMKSLVAAVTARKLQHLEKLNLRDNKLSEAAMVVLLQGLAAAVTGGKLQHLNEVDLRYNELSAAAVTPLLHALLNTLGDRKLTLRVVGNYWDGIIIAPSENKSVQHYVQQIRQ